MKLQLLCGPIASGKSSYSKNAANNGIICVNDDAIVQMLHGNNYSLYNENLKLLYKSIENNVVSTALAMNKQVLIDRGLNCSIRGRKRWLALANSFDVLCEAIIFKNEGSRAHAERRTINDSRGHSFEYWLNVAELHNKEYEEPTVEEGFSAVHYISFEEIKDGEVL